MSGRGHEAEEPGEAMKSAKHFDRIGKRKRRGVDSHQVIGAISVLGVLVALVALALGRFDVAVMAGVFAGLAIAVTGPLSRGSDGGGGIEFGSDCDGGDGGGD